MDELTQYLKTGKYIENELEQILNKKIIITEDHIKHINMPISNFYGYNFNIITLFEKYGYVFTDDDYILMIRKNGNIIEYISKDKLTNNMCEIAVRQGGILLRYIPSDKRTNELCKLAVQENAYLIIFVPEDKKTEEICRIAFHQDNMVLPYIPDDKKYLFIKNEIMNI